MVEALIALGSNLGDRQMIALKAIEAIEALPGTMVHQVSHFYRTAPVGPIAQEWYLNACLRVETVLAPHELLDALQGIERHFGRMRASEPRWGPRTLDLDILLYGDEHLDTPELTLPHPAMLERAFVLVPLLDVMLPDHPLHLACAAALHALDRAGVAAF